ncbi:MAG: carbamoyltransferase HypF [Clostridia bacterium]|nr:carbamoyltransferase HypF [Clostridia bacterium]
MEVRRYRITGIVQGVGFRPFVHKLALKYNTKGWILNDSEGVLMEIEADGGILDLFIRDLQNLPPPLAVINGIFQLPSGTMPGTCSTFEIKASLKLDYTDTLVPPDTHVCEDCLKEMFDQTDRRYLYPFINCTNCGPRYSIIKDMPYDRKNTTMDKFCLCEQCKAEYEDINNRRYHAQPNACPECGPLLELLDKSGKKVVTDDTIKYCIERLLEGKIFAVKSVGGFHLACNALDDNAVKELRRRKKRDLKPFALMVKDIGTALKYVYINEYEKSLLQSIQRPIVLLKKRNVQPQDPIAPKNPNYGIMLPSAPLHYLLLSSEALPVLIMTSGNISGNPIVYRNEDAVEQLGEVADYFLVNNRDIHTRVDDSIVGCSYHPELKKPVISSIRRSRGYAPYPVHVKWNLKSVLALGAELKTTAALSRDHHVFISQHIGDLKNEHIFQAHIESSKHLEKLLNIFPEAMAYDLHPLYQSTVFALEQKGLPVIGVQHHHAHMASCMAENNLENKVIGVIFDGTGYGTDGMIWGGEFLIGDYDHFNRVGCLKPFNLLGGDKAVLEPYRVGLELLIQTYGASFTQYAAEIFKEINPKDLDIYFKMSTGKIHSFAATSMGRLFDGISAILNICKKIEYEAQAAIELESLLERDFTLTEPLSYRISHNNGLNEIDYSPMIKEIVKGIKDLTDVRLLSRKFHSTVVDMVVEMCRCLRGQYSLNDVVLSGGVFLNEFLLINVILKLKEQGFNVYHHSRVPTNDGGISLGQVMVANARLQHA